MELLNRLSSGWKAWLILFLVTFTAAAPGVFNIPALDRDEARFAQASKQYIETGDYLIIRYQDEFRNKKPAGIHWLQSGATQVLGDEDKLEIWTYRVPSWIGVGLATLATFWCGLVFMSRRAAFTGALLFGATLLITSEGHISKTDGVLIFLTTWGIGALAHLYMGRAENPKRMALIFWFAMGCGLLIKGPVTPMVAAYAGFGAWIWAKAGEGKGGDWWRPLIWWPGPLLAVAMFLPWLIAIQFATDGTFLQGAVGKDLKDKFAGASEGHAGWPLYHLSHIPVWFFPAVILLIPGMTLAWKHLRGSSDAARKRGTDALFVLIALGALTAFATWILPGELGNGAPSAYAGLILVGFWWLSTRPEWQNRWAMADPAPITDETKAVRFLVAWGLLTTIFFELMPTRLSHYIMPAYPAMALLCGWACFKLLDGAKLPVSRWLSFGIYVLGGALLVFVSSPLAARLIKTEAAGDFQTVPSEQVIAQWANYVNFPLWFWYAGGAVFVLSMILFAAKRLAPALLLGVVTSLFLGWHARIYVLPTQLWAQPTESARLALQGVCGLPFETCTDGTESPERILAIGYAEPSYVMSFGTQNLHPPETPMTLPADASAYPVVYLINLEDRGSPARRCQALGDECIPSALEIRDDLLRQADTTGLCVTQSDPVYALNYSNGDPAHFVAYRFDADC
ncbi:MAG: glycosyltransferase family 39 protein [Hyphomonadaceae bacterium]|nr:glycosyltransferase family 39 protein [Hyphomonadaceae bacterium]